MSFLIFTFGLLFGSLANVILLRFNTGELLVWGGSRCFGCARRLEWFELVPLFSFLFLRARCRTCKSRISWQYPLVEFGTGILFLIVYLTLTNFQFSIINFQSIFNYQFSSDVWIPSFKYLILNTEYLILVIAAWYALWLSALYDFRHKILPDFFNYSAFVLAILSAIVAQAASSGFSSLLTVGWLSFGELRTLSVAEGLFTKLLVSAALFLFFFFLWFLSKGRWMGLGDAKFVLAFGFLIPATLALLAVILAFWIGAIVGISLVILSKLSESDSHSNSHSKRRLWESDFHIKSEIPFGPFLFLGGILSFSLGEKIINWYIQLF